MIENDLIVLIEEYTGHLVTDNIENLCVYHDLNIYGDDADELLSKYAKTFAVSLNDFHFTDYFPNEGDSIIETLKSLFTGKKQNYKPLTLGDLQKGIENKELNDRL